MATDIRVPTLGESVTEATIGKWFKKVGDSVAADETLVELETDKVTVEVPAPAAGVLAEIAAKDGETVGVGAILGAIEAASGAKAAKTAPAAAPTKPEAVAQASAPTAAATVKEAEALTAKIAGDVGQIEPRTMPPAPAAAKLLAESNIAVFEAAAKEIGLAEGDVGVVAYPGEVEAALVDQVHGLPVAIPLDENNGALQFPFQIDFPLGQHGVLVMQKSRSHSHAVRAGRLG